MSASLEARIRDHLAPDWLTPSQQVVWDVVHQFDGPPHRVINIFGSEGTGKTFLGWLMEQQRYATYGMFLSIPKPILPRLTLDNSRTDRHSTRELRPLVDKHGLQQIILLSRARVDEPGMPSFELRVTDEDLERLRANLYRFLRMTVPEGPYRDYKAALKLLG
jgi:hypothetical protein